MITVIDCHDTSEPLQRLGAMIMEPATEAVAHARDWFLKLTAGLDLACSVDDCLLMLSELVTNAIIHGPAPGDWTVYVEWWRFDTGLIISVEGPGNPADVQMRQPTDDESHGRGLCLVNALAGSWDVGPSHLGTRVTVTMHHAFTRTTG